MYDSKCKALDKAEARIAEIEEALEQIMAVSGTSCLHYKMARQALNGDKDE